MKRLIAIFFVSGCGIAAANCSYDCNNHDWVKAEVDMFSNACFHLDTLNVGYKARNWYVDNDSNSTVDPNTMSVTYHKYHENECGAPCTVVALPNGTRSNHASGPGGQGNFISSGSQVMYQGCQPPQS